MRFFTTSTGNSVSMMGKLVVLKLDGDLEQLGFRVTLEIGQEGERPEVELVGSLPNAPELATHLQRHWQDKYRSVGAPSRIKPKRITYDGSVNRQIQDCTESAVQLRERLTAWLDSEEFRPIDKRLREELSRFESIRVLIKTESFHLQKLPWHLWDFFERYPHAEVALSPPKCERIDILPTATPLAKVKILAILGHREGIDIDADRQLLENLPGVAETVFLVEPQRQDINDQLWEQSWDILFFAGHSETEGETGRIYINPQESLTIPELGYALKKAIQRGLKLAIFNSCDGLGLARQLHDVQIPQIIVMREVVPDEVAQAFLKHFLTAFADRKSFYLAVREARERLQGLESRFPCASWLPVICQNPAAIPLRWPELPGRSQRVPRWRRCQSVLLTSLAVTSLLVGVRSLGFLQVSELYAFDHLMRLRPLESADKRLLIIAADEEDINQYGHPLPDAILTQLLNKLNLYKPAVIGLDIVRDRPVPPGYEALAAYLKQNENPIAVCALGKELEQSIAPPPQSSETQVGFVDLYDDSDFNSQDYTVRRYLLSRTPNAISKPSRCTTPYSFAWKLAYRYLQAKGIPVETVKNDWNFGSIAVKRLSTRSGGYQTLDARGYQLLINYRNTPQIAQEIGVRDVLTESDRFDPALVKDRVILIGVTAASVQDTHHTPYGRMRGLYVHAHVVSQILSAVEDNNRPLLWWWPQWGDALWILFWSLSGGVIVWCWQAPLYRGLATGICVLVLYGLCWFVLTKGGWIPLIPPALAFISTGGIVVIYATFQNLKNC